MKICRVGAELLQVEGNTKRDRNDEANSRFRTFANEPKNGCAFRGDTHTHTHTHTHTYIYMFILRYNTRQDLKV